MTSWPRAIATFYLAATVLLLLLLNNLRELGNNSASMGIVIVCAMGLVAGVVLTVFRLAKYARAAGSPDVARRRGPLSEPVDAGRAVTWAAVGATGLLLIVLADRFFEDRAFRLTVFVVGAVVVGLSYWRLWRTPLRPRVPPRTGDDVPGNAVSDVAE